MAFATFAHRPSLAREDPIDQGSRPRTRAAQLGNALFDPAVRGHHLSRSSEGWLPCGPGATYHQCALFEPHGLAGHLYWKSIAPFHAGIFGGMARNITGAAESSRT
ncbi:DUF2867 domain-containing protein [Nocardia gamkensis]|uniref:DUF2867 domain-containing protein n=1 Tax=Nocardia gamkensis TaxID=352869 RepID=UPI00359FAA2E